MTVKTSSSLLLSLIFINLIFFSKALSDERPFTCSAAYFENGKEFYGSDLCKDILENLQVDFDYDGGECSYNVGLIEFYMENDVMSFYYTEAQTCNNLARVFSYFRAKTIAQNSFKHTTFERCSEISDDIFFNGENVLILNEQADPIEYELFGIPYKDALKRCM